MMFMTYGRSENLVQNPGFPLSGFSDQYRSENTLGEYKFGYNEDHRTGGSFRRESSDRFGNKVGSYGLRVADGRVRIVNYVADEDGFRADVISNEPGVQSQESNPHSKITRKSISAVIVPELRYSSKAPHLTFQTDPQIEGHHKGSVYSMASERGESPVMYRNSESDYVLDVHHPDSESGLIHHDKRNKDGIEVKDEIDSGIISTTGTTQQSSARSQKNDDFRNLRNDYFSNDHKSQSGVNSKVEEIQDLNENENTGDVGLHDGKRNLVTHNSQIYRYVNFNAKEDENIGVRLRLRNDGDFTHTSSDIHSNNDEKFQSLQPSGYDEVQEDLSHPDKNMAELDSFLENINRVDRSEFSQEQINTQFVNSQSALILDKYPESDFKMQDERKESSGLFHDIHMHLQK